MCVFFLFLFFLPWFELGRGFHCLQIGCTFSSFGLGSGLHCLQTTCKFHCLNVDCDFHGMSFDFVLLFLKEAVVFIVF